MKNKEEIKKFFEYVLDKVEDCYKNEVAMAIKDFIKETDLEVPVQDQHKTIIELNENQQKQLFCIALHLSNFLADKSDLRWNCEELPIDELKKLVETTSKVTTACEFCIKYGKECAKLTSEGKQSYYSKSLKMLTELTGVRFLSADKERDLIRVGKLSFFKK